MATYPGTASDAWNRLDSYYSGSAYSPTNPGGMANNGHRLNYVPSLQDVAAVAAEVAGNAVIAASAASQQYAWGPSFSTADGSVTFVSATSFTTVGDLPSDITVGTHITADCGVDGFRYGIVTNIVGTSTATVTVSLYEGVLTSHLRSVYNVETRMIYITDYLDVVAAQTSCAASQDAALASERNAAAHETGAQTAAIAAAASSMATAPIRDTLGKFVGVIQPSLNLFCPDMTSDAVPIGTFTRSTGGYRMGPTGLYEWVAGGLIRREWDYNGNLLGWLLEGGSTNLLPYSQEFENAAWGNVWKSSISSNATTAPDGSMTADKLVEDSSLNAHTLTIPKTITANTQYAFSIFIKGAGRTQGRIYVQNGSFSNYIGCSFNLTTCTASLDKIGAATNAQVGIIAYINGWYRVWFTGIIDPSLTGAIYVVEPYLNGAESYQGDGVSGLYIWGAQLEVGAFPTSYIPTTSAAATRAADVWTVPTSAFPFNASEGTFFVSADRIATASNYARFFEAYDVAGSNAITLAVDPGGALYSSVYANSVQYYDWNPFPSYTGNGTKLAQAYKINNLGFSKDGVAKPSDTSAATMPTGLTNLRIGSDSVGGCTLNGHIRHLAYFPRRLPDAALQSITA